MTSPMMSYSDVVKNVKTPMNSKMSITNNSKLSSYIDTPAQTPAHRQTPRPTPPSFSQFLPVTHRESPYMHRRGAEAYDNSHLQRAQQTENTPRQSVHPFLYTQGSHRPGVAEQFKRKLPFPRAPITAQLRQPLPQPTGIRAPPPFVISPDQSVQQDHSQFGVPSGRIGPANRSKQDTLTFDSTSEPEKGKDKKSLARSESQTELSLHASSNLFESCNNSNRKTLARSESESELSLHASNNLLERSHSSPELSLYASNQLFSPGFNKERHPSLTDSVPDDRSFRPAIVPQSTPKVSPDTTCLSLNPSFNLYRESRPIDSESDSDDALSCEASNNLFKTAAIQNRTNTIYYRKLKE